MTLSKKRRQELVQAAQSTAVFELAYVGIVNGLLTSLHDFGPCTCAELAEAAGADAGYVERWLDAAYAFELVDATDDRFELADLGDAFRPEADQTMMPLAVKSILGAHMTERAAGLMATGERPGEEVLAERETVLPWFGPMLEVKFGPMFEEQIVGGVPVYEKADAEGGVAVDLGCGNGWYLRKLVSRFDNLRGIGLDGFEQNVSQAAELADKEGVGDRLEFRTGDIFDFAVDQPVDLIAMNRAMHHVWHDRDRVFDVLYDHLKPGGSAVIWEPNYPTDRSELRHPARRGLAVQNLSEHVQGNHLLNPAQIEAAFEEHGMEATTHLFFDGTEAVIVGTKTS